MVNKKLTKLPKPSKLQKWHWQVYGISDLHEKIKKKNKMVETRKKEPLAEKKEKILLDFIRQEIKINKSKNIHYYKGRYWMYGLPQYICSKTSGLIVKDITEITNHLRDRNILLKERIIVTPKTLSFWYAFVNEDDIE